MNSINNFRAILVGKEVVPEPDLANWGAWMETPERLLWRHEQGGFAVSTVFLGLNHGFGRGDLWFETLVFENEAAGEMRRYATYDEAWAGHRDVVARALGIIVAADPPPRKYPSE